MRLLHKTRLNAVGASPCVRPRAPTTILSEHAGARKVTLLTPTHLNNIRARYGHT